MKSYGKGKDSYTSGLSRKNPLNEGDPSRKVPTEKSTVNSDTTRDGVAKSHSIGGRVA